MALDALDFLVAIKPTLTLLRAGDDALRIPVAGSAERPWASRTRRVNWAAASAHTPSARNRSYQVRTVWCAPKSVGRDRQGQPVCSRWKQPFTISRISAVKVK